MLHCLLGDAELLDDFLVALKDLDRIPSLLVSVHIVEACLFDVSQSVLYGAGEGVGRNSLCSVSSLDGFLCCLLDAGALKSGDGYCLAAHLL